MERRWIINFNFIKFLYIYQFLFTGNYTCDDKPNQRGELIIGSKSVSIGYFNNEEETEKYFDEDDVGLRWFSTGDIVEIYADRTIKIIDCKRDLIKLHNGYCISLSKVSLNFVNLIK